MDRTQSESITDIAPALVAALASLEDVQKHSTADTGTYSYRYADLAAIMGHIRSTLGEHELVVMQDVQQTDRAVAVSTTLMHSSGQWVSSSPCVVPIGNGGAQAIGSAITYARRYSLLPWLGLATEDDDGKAAQEAATAPHPNSDRVAAVMAEMRSSTDTQKAALKQWADGRSLSGSKLLADDRWLELVEEWLDQRTDGGSSDEQ